MLSIMVLMFLCYFFVDLVDYKDSTNGMSNRAEKYYWNKYFWSFTLIILCVFTIVCVNNGFTSIQVEVRYS